MKTNTLTRLFGALMATGLMSAAAHAVPVLSYGGSDYYLTTTAGTWTAGEAEAIGMGGHLVTINDAAEESAILAAFGSSLFWIGFTDAAVEGTFVWSSGQAVTYTNWSAGEPNNFGPEHYTVISWNALDAWNDLANGNSFVGIIEVASPVPEPGSLALAGLALLGLYASSRRKT